eukprot:393555-Amphidinium_carterae.1
MSTSATASERPARVQLIVQDQDVLQRGGHEDHIGVSCVSHPLSGETGGARHIIPLWILLRRISYCISERRNARAPLKSIYKKTSRCRMSSEVSKMSGCSAGGWAPMSEYATSLVRCETASLRPETCIKREAACLFASSYGSAQSGSRGYGMVNKAGGQSTRRPAFIKPSTSARKTAVSLRVAAM